MREEEGGEGICWKRLGEKDIDLTVEDHPLILVRDQGRGGAELGETGSISARGSEEEKRRQTDHKTVYLS